jgi:formylglycine-generating enzyme required for sulfatase activity
MYPQGDSLQKVSDLAGNVWEWCRTPIRFPSTSGNKYGNPALNDPVVLRGGSWFNGQDIARVDYRGDYRPSDRYINIGFRMVCSAPIR